MVESNIFILKVNPRSRVTTNKYRKQIQCRQNKVQEFIGGGIYPQQEISSNLYIGQPRESRDISFIKKNNFQKVFDPKRTTKKFNFV